MSYDEDDVGFGLSDGDEMDEPLDMPLEEAEKEELEEEEDPENRYH